HVGGRPHGYKPDCLRNRLAGFPKTISGTFGAKATVLACYSQQKSSPVVAGELFSSSVSCDRGYTNSLTSSRSSRMYIGRPLPFGNVCDGSMPIAWYSVASTCGTV